MGGFGSGRPGWKPKAEACLAIDVNQLNRWGGLQPGRAGTMQFSRNGENVGSIDWSASLENLKLGYRVKKDGESWHQITENVNLTYVNCRYGGRRPYFLCPGTGGSQSCRRRVEKLFFGGRHFQCRHCCQIAYSSQSKIRVDRLLRKVNKRRRALGGAPGIYSCVAPRPKGMWRRTYERRVAEIWDIGDEALRELRTKFSGQLSQEELDMYF